MCHNVGVGFLAFSFFFFFGRCSRDTLHNLLLFRGCLINFIVLSWFFFDLFSYLKTFFK